MFFVGCCHYLPAGIYSQLRTILSSLQRQYRTWLWDVSYSAFNVRKDDSYTGPGTVAVAVPQTYTSVEIEQKFNTDWFGENAVNYALDNL